MRFIILILTTALFLTSCTTYDTPITTKQKSKKKAFQTKALREHDLIGHVKSCETEIYEYTKATDPSYKAPEGAYMAVRKGAHTLPDTPSFKGNFEFSKKGEILKRKSSGLGIGTDDFLAAINDENNEKLLTLKDAKKAFNNKGKCSNESTRDITISYLYDSIGNCNQRKIIYHNSKFRDFTTQRFTYDTLGNWIQMATHYRYKPAAVTNPYTEQKIVRKLTYWTSEELRK